LYIYAVCNLNDVSWGTPEDNALQKLHSLQSFQDTSSGKECVFISLKQVDHVEEDFRNSREMLQSKSYRKSKESPSMTHEDRVNNTRINTLLFWIMTNILVVYIQTDESAWSWIHDRLYSLKWESELVQVSFSYFPLVFLFFGD
jgi:hypothetical protein